MAELQEEALWLRAGDDEEALDDPELRRLFSYWSRVAPAGSAPKRQDIDPPIDLPTFLPTTIIFNVERSEDGALAFPYRLVGTKLTEYARRDLRGLTVEEAFGSEFVARDMEIYRRVVEDCVCYSGARTSMIETRQLFERYKRLVMPILGNESGSVDMVWSWLKFCDPPSTTD